MKKRKVVKKTRSTRTRSNTRHTEKNLIYGIEQEFVLIFGGGFAVVVLGIFIMFMR